ncbi:hypothetical protein CPB86DRAFT_793994 [Serendipita vermifera]|nr:hypothetical protein CPB86DRAFT_793994 [Serendipita vermifera]
MADRSAKYVITRPEEYSELGLPLGIRNRKGSSTISPSMVSESQAYEWRVTCEQRQPFFDRVGGGFSPPWRPTQLGYGLDDGTYPPLDYKDSNVSKVSICSRKTPQAHCTAIVITPKSRYLLQESDTIHSLLVLYDDNFIHNRSPIGVTLSNVQQRDIQIGQDMSPRVDIISQGRWWFPELCGFQL